MIRFVIPIKTSNPLNGAQGRTRGAVFAKAARRKKERQAANFSFRFAFAQERGNDWPATLGWPVEWPRPLPVRITRLSVGHLDGDGLQAALKSVRDGLADALGVNDGSDAVLWKYDQRKSKRGVYGVEVEVGLGLEVPF